jgi:hypothetical protein
MTDDRFSRTLPSVFFFRVGDGVACGALVGVVTGVMGPGVGGLVGALALGAESDDTTRMATIKSAVSTTTVTAARSIPRRGFGVGLLPKTTHSCGKVERASLSNAAMSATWERYFFSRSTAHC